MYLSLSLQSSPPPDVHQVGPNVFPPSCRLKVATQVQLVAPTPHSSGWEGGMKVLPVWGQLLAYEQLLLAVVVVVARLLVVSCCCCLLFANRVLDHRCTLGMVRNVICFIWSSLSSSNAPAKTSPPPDSGLCILDVVLTPRLSDWEWPVASLVLKTAHCTTTLLLPSSSSLQLATSALTETAEASIPTINMYHWATPSAVRLAGVDWGGFCGQTGAGRGSIGATRPICKIARAVGYLVRQPVCMIDQGHCPM
ncbi:hypothetical protein C8F01DRAFT_1089537 [Mycena amicta]|nr:hypothetical protein C8F01DRAFT_1089537 [Mycena amicta]